MHDDFKYQETPIRGTISLFVCGYPLQKHSVQYVVYFLGQLIESITKLFLPEQFIPSTKHKHLFNHDFINHV